MRADDLELLNQFLRDHSQDAFSELVKRHLSLVYSAALRQVRSSQLAEEVSQSVFSDLARDAARFKTDTILSAWLYQVTRRTAIDVVRRESRRQARERLAVEMADMNSIASDWTAIEPLLDEAMEALDETDRVAVLLRYFENRSLREVGERIGTSDDAAQKRVSRAVERLREFFAKRGLAVGASGLAVVISVNAVQAAPSGMAITISAAALTGIAATTSTVIAATSKTIAMTTLQKTVFSVAVVVLAGAGIYEARQAAQLRDQVRALQQQQAPLTEQIRKLQSNFPSASNQRATATNEAIDLLKTEVLRLRASANRAQAAEAELAALKSAQQQPQNAQATNPQMSNEQLTQIARTIDESVANRTARLKSRLALTEAQTQSIQEILRTTNAGFERDSKIRQLLSQEQQSWYDALKEDELRPSIIVRTGAALSELQKAVDLSAKEQDQAFAAIFQSLLTSMLQISKASNQADASALARRMKEQQLSALDSVLRPEQLAQYRAYLSRKAGSTSASAPQ